MALSDPLPAGALVQDRGRPVAAAAAPAPGSEPAPAAEALSAGVATVLRAACRSVELTTLELHVAGAPCLSTFVRRRPRGALREMVVWPTSVPACEWHAGLLLVATAPAADATRRSAVRDAAAVVAELLVAEGRRVQAESAAHRAIELAGVDALTGLGNRWTWRRALDDEADRAARYSGPSSVVVLDLDGLKLLNDTQGHAAGDAHLRRTSAALRAVSRAVDVVCRLGGDEFAVLAPETDADGAGRLVDRLRTSLTSAGIEASIGVATTEGGDLENAWHVADIAMYEVKRSRASARR